ncbi:MAG: hypothetical protein AAGA80_24885, partial [Cyanobacteria bacterium P01_F01_bin.143]
MNSNKNKRDGILLVVLLIFNLGSLATTILGAREIMPKNLAWIVGFGVQMMLFLLLANFILKRSFYRKWFAILVCTIFSIYTSFFWYYQSL